MVERIPGIIARQNRMHEENESRFDKIENRLSQLVGEMRILIGLILASGVINYFHK